MRADGGSIHVYSETAVVGDGQLVPSVRVVTLVDRLVHATGVEIHVTPAQARRVGLDLIAAASAAMADTGVRRAARAHGYDGDGIVEAMATVVAETLDREP